MEITSFDPTSGSVNTAVTLSLSDMPSDSASDNTSVYLNGLSTVTVNTVDPQAGTVGITIGPNSQSGEFVVVVQSPSQGTVSAQSADNFTVGAQPEEPQIESMRPNPVSVSQQLALTGRNLQSVKSVFIGVTRIYNIQVSSTMIRLTVPGSVQAGKKYRVAGQTDKYGKVYAPGMLSVTSGS
ncbi:IPT/TIG domain-containing protein [Streptomyces sp. YIM 98790]|uniref:IPT/TIG domain-containing protein n=1 Tax=Streptomyces sp. YIM 98790 TaxID=2689077 RepID=UPI0014085890|nr:IPT/TIG domain-containing protein [Streptomyces sp. YIM 98790]